MLNKFLLIIACLLPYQSSLVSLKVTFWDPSYLFTVYVNDLPSVVKSSKILLFADDAINAIKLYITHLIFILFNFTWTPSLTDHLFLKLSSVIQSDLNLILKHVKQILTLPITVQYPQMSLIMIMI